MTRPTEQIEAAAEQLGLEFINWTLHHKPKVRWPADYSMEERTRFRNAATLALEAAALAAAQSAPQDLAAHDPTDYKAEFFKLRDEVHHYRDFLTKAEKDAESILRPYLNSGAVFGIIPDHRFREIDQLPIKLLEDIASALAVVRDGLKKADELLASPPPVAPAVTLTD